MTTDAERAARVPAWNDVRSLGFSTWKRHAVPGFAAEHTPVGDTLGVARTVYRRHASFAGYAWRRWAEAATPRSGVQDIGWVFRRRSRGRRTLVDGLNAFHDAMPLALPESGTSTSELTQRGLAWNPPSSARIGIGLIAPAPARSTSLARARFLAPETTLSSPFGSAGFEFSRTAERNVVVGLTPPRRLASKAITRIDSLQSTEMPTSMSQMRGSSSIEHVLRRLSAVGQTTSTTTAGRRALSARLTDARATAPSIHLQTGANEKERFQVESGMSGLSAQIDTGELQEREPDVRSTAATVVLQSGANETQRVQATSSMRASDFERPAPVAYRLQREPLGLIRLTGIPLMQGGPWAFPKAITPGAAVAATIHPATDTILASSRITAPDSERSADPAVTVREPLATTASLTRDVANATMAVRRAQEPLTLTWSTGTPTARRAWAFPKAITPGAAVAATIHPAADTILASSRIAASDSERSADSAVTVREPLATTASLTRDVANAAMAVRRAQEPLTLSWSTGTRTARRASAFPKAIAPGTAVATTYLLTTVAKATASSLPLIDHPAIPRADQPRDFADLPSMPLATGGEVFDSPAALPIHVINEMPTPHTSVISRAPSDTLPGFAENTTVTAPFVLPRLQQPMRLRASKWKPVTGSHVQVFAKTLDRTAGGKPNLVVTAASRTTDTVPSVDPTAAGVYTYRRPRVTERTVEVERRAHVMLTPSSDLSGSALASAGRPEDTSGVVPVPVEARAGPNSESRFASDAGDASESRADRDEIAQHAWRAIMDRLTIEQERRGFARWP